MSDGLEIITTRLLVTNVGVQRGVPGCACEVLALSEGNVLAIRVLVALSEPKIDDVDIVFSTFSASDQKVVRFNVTVDDAFLVNLLNALDLIEILLRAKLLTIYKAMWQTVFKSNLRRHSWKRSSRLFPSKSITITWYCLPSSVFSSPT